MCRVISEIKQNGEQVAYFQCGGDPAHPGESIEDRWCRTMAEEQEHELDRLMAREATKLHDPNLCDSRQVRRELREPKFVNLGNRAYRVPSTARHF